MSFMNPNLELYAEVDGALQASKMRFLLSIPEGKGKAITKGSVIAALSVAIIALTLCAVSWVLGREPARQEDLLADMIGMTQEEAFNALSESDLGLVQIEAASYVIPEGEKIAGQDFAVQLSFDENEGLLDSFAYLSESKLNPKEASRVISDFLGAYYSGTVTLADGREVSLNRRALQKELESGNAFSLSDSENTTYTPFRVAEYIQYLEEAEYFEGRMGEYLIKHAYFYRDIDLCYEDGVLSIRAQWAVEADRSK